ncbi:MICOS complex subunit [Dirofilaria immitis]
MFRRDIIDDGCSFRVISVIVLSNKGREEIGNMYKFHCFMGSTQSYEESLSSNDHPKVLKIERSEIPEEYRTVAVSRDVVDQILNLGSSESENINDLRKQLAEERDVNCKLREQIKNLTESKISLQKTTTGKISMAELKARKDAFDETLERIEKQYFSYQSENVCKMIETDLMECINKNKNKLLNCTAFAVDLTKCASDFREKVLKEISHL